MTKFIVFILGFSFAVLWLWIEEALWFPASMKVGIVYLLAGIVIGGWVIGLLMYCFATKLIHSIPTAEITDEEDDMNEGEWWKYGKKPPY